MKLIYHGHACFELVSSEGSIVFDPYERGYVKGFRLPEITADTVFCSHGHRDHNAAGEIRLSGRTPSFRLSELHSFHDNCLGELRGENRIAVLDVEGMRVVHCGDLGHRLDSESLKELGTVDILLLPIGGRYTVDAEEAYEIARAVGARITIPMHYKIGDRGISGISECEDFLRLFSEDELVLVDGSEITIDGLSEGDKPLVFRLSV